MPNVLPLEARRVGDLYDSYEDTPEVKTTLYRSERGVEVTIAWSGPEVPYAAWFMKEPMFSRNVTQSNEGRPLPNRLMFQDSSGSVLLIGCRASGLQASMHGPGSGTIRARAAILGVDRDFEFDQPHGIRTQITGLREWVGVSSWLTEFEHPTGAVINSQKLSVYNIGERDGLKIALVPSWRVNPTGESGNIELEDLLYCETWSDDGRHWADHMGAHRAIRDLLAISSWSDVTCVEVMAKRRDDLLVSLDGVERGEQWRRAVVKEDPRPKEGDRTLHLIYYNDLVEAGVQRWLDIRNSFSRALDPVITSYNIRGATPLTLLAHTGPGLEALGYLLFLRDGASESRAGGAPLIRRLERILEDLYGCLPFDEARWPGRFAAAYNGLKHANREMPDELEILNVWRESVLVVRAWVCIELGISFDVVRARLSRDPQKHEYVRT